MGNNTQLNYLALHQNIFGKPMIFGSGPTEGKAKDPITSFEGLKIYLNGTHDLAEIIGEDDLELNEIFLFGQMTHPTAMAGMPGISGRLKYELGISNKFYFLIIRLKLDESANGKSDDAVDFLTIIKKSEIPETFNHGDDNNYVLAKEMLLSHFDKLFEFCDTYEQAIEEGFEFDEEQVAFNEVVKYYFDLKKSISDIGDYVRKN